MPQRLDQTHFKGPHAENCEKAKARLLELNPGHNVFIYWHKSSSPTIDLYSYEKGTFISSSPKDPFYKRSGWEYGYIVFLEGIILWPDGDRRPEYLCYTQNSCDVVGMGFMFRNPGREVPWANWMGALRAKLGGRQSELYLSSLALPSTHNSHCRTETIAGFFSYVSSFAECQSKTITEQLNMGVRCIDLRVGPDLILRHGLATLKDHLNVALQEISNFLDQHPQETVMFQAKWDQKPYSDENRRMVADLVRAEVLKYPRALISDQQPTLANCIGKMVLYNDNGFGAWSPQGPEYKDQGTGESDFSRKWNSVAITAQKILCQKNVRDGRFHDLWLSAETIGNFPGEMTRPKSFAEHVNPLFFKWLIDNRGQGRVGRVNMDFARQYLVNEIVMWNFDADYL